VIFTNKDNDVTCFICWNLHNVDIERLNSWVCVLVCERKIRNRGNSTGFERLVIKSLDAIKTFVQNVCPCLSLFIHYDKKWMDWKPDMKEFRVACAQLTDIVSKFL
jgi:hypothetical protein